MTFPEWVQKHKTPGKEVRNIKERYYLYEVTSKYDPAKKRSQKVTGRYLGRIKPEGLIKPKRETLQQTLQQISVKEYGATYFALTHCSNIIELLKNIPRRVGTTHSLRHRKTLPQLTPQKRADPLRSFQPL